jgi:hypothetical protein
MSLLKVRKEKYKGKHCGAQVKPQTECVSALQVLLKPTITYGKGKTRWFSFNNE